MVTTRSRCCETSWSSISLLQKARLAPPARSGPNLTWLRRPFRLLRFLLPFLKSFTYTTTTMCREQSRNDPRKSAQDSSRASSTLHSDRQVRLQKGRGNSIVALPPRPSYHMEPETPSRQPRDHHTAGPYSLTSRLSLQHPPSQARPCRINDSLCSTAASWRFLCPHPLRPRPIPPLHHGIVANHPIFPLGNRISLLPHPRLLWLWHLSSMLQAKYIAPKRPVIHHCAMHRRHWR